MGISVDAGGSIFGCSLGEVGSFARSLGFEDEDDFGEISEYLQDSLWFRFITLYATKYPSIQSHSIQPYTGLSWAGGVYIPRDEYTFYLGATIDDFKRKNGKWQVVCTLPKGFRAIVKDFVAFYMKYAKEYFFNRAKTQLAIVPKGEVEELLKDYKIPKHLSIESIISISA